MVEPPISLGTSIVNLLADLKVPNEPVESADAETLPTTTRASAGVDEEPI